MKLARDVESVQPGARDPKQEVYNTERENTLWTGTDIDVPDNLVLDCVMILPYRAYPGQTNSNITARVSLIFPLI